MNRSSEMDGQLLDWRREGDPTPVTPAEQELLTRYLMDVLAEGETDPEAGWDEAEVEREAKGRSDD